MSKLISVIVPVYNVENYLHRCIKCVLEQSYKNIQLILIDDGSVDLSGEICDYYAKMDSRVIVVHQENKGVSAARNLGLDYCRGEYFCFLDSDDAYATDILESAVEQLEKTDADVVFFGWEKRYSDGNVENWLPGVGEVLDLKKALMELLCNFSAFGGGYPNKLWNINAFEGDIPRYNIELTYFEDSEWMSRMFLELKRGTLLNKIGYLYYIRENSVTFRKGTEERKELGYHKSMLQIIENLEKEPSLQKWFKDKYFPELINGFVHSKRKKWKELEGFLGKEIERRKNEILQNSKLTLKIRLRCLGIILSR